jgi:hypothetical protein
MNVPDKKIIKFINKHHLLNLATSANNIPYAASCFYLYLEDKNTLIFASDEKTKHIQDCLNQPIVAGTIALETFFISRIRGIQFKGTINEVIDDSLRKKYIKRFPLALFIPFKLWAVKLHYIKMTDNSMGFGKKLFWEIHKVD